MPHAPETRPTLLVPSGAQQPGSPAGAQLALDQLPLIARLIWLANLLVLLGLAALPLIEVTWRPPSILVAIARIATVSGAVLLLGELGCAAVWLIYSTHRVSTAAHHYLRIRTPNPHSSRATLSENQPDGADFWYAAHHLFPSHTTAPGPWLATTLSARPDEPVEFGAVIGGGSKNQQHQWRAALRQIIIGQCVEASVDSPPDPLNQAITAATGQAGAGLAWGEFLLPRSPAYPLRLPESATTDLLGPLLAQLRPRAGRISYAEGQIITQPRHDWRSDDFGWRAAAHRRLVQLRGKAHYGVLSADGRALEQKLGGPAANTLLRIVLVANSQAAARQTLREIGSVLGQYAQRSGQYQQRFVRAGQGFIDLSTPVPPAASSRWLHWAAAILLCCLLVAGAWQSGLIAWVQAAFLRLLLPCLCASMPLLLLSAQRRISSQARLSHWRRRLCARAPRLVPPIPFLLPIPAWWAPAILSVGELGGIWHLPSPNFGALARWLPARNLPAPPHAFIDPGQNSAPAGSQRITIGHALRSDGQLAPVGPYLADLRTIGHLTAGMGAGKSRFLANLCQQIMADGFTLIDGKGDDAGNLTATVRQYIRQADERRVVLIDITDSDWPIGMNPLADLAIDTPGAIDRVTAQIQSIFARLDPDGWSAAPGMQQFLDMATRLVVETVPLPTVAHVKQALIDQHYRTQLLGDCAKLEIKTFWQILFPASSEQQKSSVNALMRRFDKLLLSEVVRALITQQRPTFRFSQAITERLIVLCPIPHVSYGPLASTAAMLLLQSFMRAAFERPGSATTRHDYPLIVDEFQVLVEHGATQDVAVALTQLRSLGIPTLYSHQALAQLGELRDLMLINAENRILMRTQEPDASIYAQQYAAAGLSSADIANQEPTEHQYARFVVGGKTVGPISIVPLAWPSAINVTPERYSGRDWQTVTPAGDPQATDYDRQLVSLIYGRPYQDDLALRLAHHLSEQEWQLLNQRWAAIAQTQRQYILDHPGCIPNRDQRVRWLSRLGYARPRLLAEAEFLRIRQCMGAGEHAAR